MKIFEFEIQNCIKVKVPGNTKEEARSSLIDDLDLYSNDMLENCYISDGDEVKSE